LARVVIVDDSLLIRGLLGKILTEAGHEVVGEAEDGLQAPLVVRELRPELVMLDLVMPGRSGMSALRHMLLVDPSLSVVVCSASCSQSRVIEALRLGAKGFIVKPLDWRQVLVAVNSALGSGGCDCDCELADPRQAGARAFDAGLESSSRPTVDDDATIDHLHNVARELSVSLGEILEAAVDAGHVTLDHVLALNYQPLQGSALPALSRLFDVSHVSVKGFDPPKFQTAYDALVDRAMMQRMDAVLAGEPQLTFALPLDLNAYAPAHNTVFTRDCSGDRLHDLEANRTKRFFLESAALTRAARMDLDIEAPGRRLSRLDIERAGLRLRDSAPDPADRFVVTAYRRDTGAELTTLSVPLYVKAHRWGVVTLGWDPTAPGHGKAVPSEALGVAQV
jgi:DNA-binding NarL/FixJ family response regulator